VSAYQPPTRYGKAANSKHSTQRQSGHTQSDRHTKGTLQTLDSTRPGLRIGPFHVAQRPVDASPAVPTYYGMAEMASKTAGPAGQAMTGTH